MVPKSILSSGNSPPRKFKKTKTNIDSNTEFPTEMKNVPGGSGWSLGKSKEDKTMKKTEETSTKTHCEKCGFNSKSKTELDKHHKEKHEQKQPTDLKNKGLGELPEKVKALNKYKDCLRLHILGNGACGPNCSATHNWLDGRRVTEFSGDLITHIGIHSDQCMQHFDFPRTVYLGNG